MTPIAALALAAALAASTRTDARGAREGRPARAAVERQVPGAARADIEAPPPDREEIALLRLQTDEALAARVAEIQGQLAALPPETRREPPPLVQKRLALGNLLAYVQGEQAVRRLRSGLPPLPDLPAPAAAPPQPVAPVPPAAPARPAALAPPAPAAAAEAVGRPPPGPVSAVALPPPAVTDARDDPGLLATLAWAAAFVIAAGTGAWLVRRLLRARPAGRTG
ncbi:MAG TPA: hypothetical protein VLU43_18640 [Anaeromyxobacteraceae bacterium]|nr:hypothetical protein [Anaeromyxobacteraceae bacterium]